MAHQEEFLLKWNDHHNSFFSIMQELCQSESLTDVTLACGGQIFETHKLMLCVCSPFFRTLLTKRPDRHPIIFLKNVDPKHLEQLLQYMYNGEINVLQDDLGPLVETARELQIKGLADAPAAPPSIDDNDDDEQQQQLLQPTLPSLPLHPAPPQSLGPVNKKARTSAAGASAVLPALINSKLSEAQIRPPPPLHNFGQIPTEPLPPEAIIKKGGPDGGRGTPLQHGEDDEEYGDVYAEQEMHSEEDQYMHDGAPLPQVPFLLAAAAAAAGLPPGLVSPMAGLPLPPPSPNNQRRHECRHCAKRFPTPSKLARHELIHTGEKPFSCTLCHKGFTQLSHLKNHQKFSHRPVFQMTPPPIAHLPPPPQPPPPQQPNQP